MTILRRITKNELQSFLHDYYHGPRKRPLGRTFLQHFYPHVTDHELFFEADDATAFSWMTRHYVEYMEAA